MGRHCPQARCARPPSASVPLCFLKTAETGDPPGRRITSPSSRNARKLAGFRCGPGMRRPPKSGCPQSKTALRPPRRPHGPAHGIGQPAPRAAPAPLAGRHPSVEPDAKVVRPAGEVPWALISVPTACNSQAAVTDRHDRARQLGEAPWAAVMKDRQNLRCSFLRACGFALLPATSHKWCYMGCRPHAVSRRAGALGIGSPPPPACPAFPSGGPVQPHITASCDQWPVAPVTRPAWLLPAPPGQPAGPAPVAPASFPPASHFAADL